MKILSRFGPSKKIAEQMYEIDRLKVELDAAKTCIDAMKKCMGNDNQIEGCKKGPWCAGCTFAGSFKIPSVLFSTHETVYYCKKGKSCLHFNERGDKERKFYRLTVSICPTAMNRRTF